MIILYNPPTGSHIEKFIYNGVMLGEHPVGELRQYDEPQAQELKKTFGFLIDVSPKEAEEIIEKKKHPTLQCKFCEFTTDVKIALEGHKRKHEEEANKVKEPAIDPDLIPIATGEKVAPRMAPSATGKMQDNLAADTSYYGPGLTETRG